MAKEIKNWTLSEVFRNMFKRTRTRSNNLCLYIPFVDISLEIHDK